MDSYELRFDKFTDNKYRWITSVTGVGFKFYIPQSSLPQPPPERIMISINTHAAAAAAIKGNIKAVVTFVQEHTETIRYAPVGDPDTWQIGEPYIPQTILPQPWPQRLLISVSWDEPTGAEHG